MYPDLLVTLMIIRTLNVLASDLDLNLSENLPNDLLLFDETVPASDQNAIFFSQDSGASDLTALTTTDSFESSILNDDASWFFSSEEDLSIAAFAPSTITDLSLGSSDPFDLAAAACLGFDDDDNLKNNNLFSSTDVLLKRQRKPRVKRQAAQCKPGGSSLDQPSSAPPPRKKRPIPTLDDLDVNVREGILRENPALNDALQRTKEDEFENNVCILLTLGLLTRGVCTSETTADWTYLGNGRFYWSPLYLFTLWNLANVTPVPPQAMGCPSREEEFVCCTEVVVENGVTPGKDCIFIDDLISSRKPQPPRQDIWY